MSAHQEIFTYVMFDFKEKLIKTLNTNNCNKQISIEFFGSETNPKNIFNNQLKFDF